MNYLLLLNQQMMCQSIKRAEKEDCVAIKRLKHLILLYKCETKKCPILDGVFFNMPILAKSKYETEVVWSVILRKTYKNSLS